MKIHNLIYTLLAAIAVFFMASCSPEDFGFGKKTYSPEDLVEGKAYTVTVEGNVVKLESKISDATPLWVTPTGRSQAQSFSIDLPFAGEYEFTFGVETPGGIVYGDPYKVTLAQNDFSLLSDNKWFLLADNDYKTGAPLPDAATLSAGVSKKWYPCDANYNIGRCTAPVMYCSPYDPDGDGAGYTADDEANGTYKDIIFGSANWKPNWDPGFQSWLVPEDDPYMDSYMTFSMDAKNGCVATMYRGEDGKKGSSTGTNMVGKFNMNLSDKTKPTITFNDCYSMHNKSFDEVCSNYTQDIQIIEMTPYLLQLATKRTNSEGNWYIVWNFVSEDVIKTKGACIPKEEQSLIEATSPKMPVIEDLITKMFTTDINGATFVGSAMTFLANDEAAYDWLWWNGASSSWESVVNGKYNETWAPKWGDLSDLEFVLERSTVDGETTYKYTLGDQSGTFTVKDNKLTFDKTISFFTIEGSRTIELKGKEWYVMKCDPGSELVLGVPETKDTNGKVNSYRVINLTYKPISSQSGPTVVPIIADNLNCYLDDKKTSLRCQLYNPWGGGGDAIADPSKLKVKKGKKLNVTVKLSGFTFSKPAKMVLCLNRGDEQEWENTCFDYSRAITVNGDGTYTVSWTNETGETQNWADKQSALTVTMQYVGYATLADESDEGYKKAFTVESVTIE